MVEMVATPLVESGGAPGGSEITEPSRAEASLNKRHTGVAPQVKKFSRSLLDATTNEGTNERTNKQYCFSKVEKKK
ncbi:hypothetical protein HZH66_000300 [Vespula vulgaris]|uniref:Uncharacterized protein n=1 Tax=Vespula vulgaris TaxID=7454 RepID=A0A834KUA6_VESVU|nr:hypothetical protein HZH66_000300 [Vespula vulgaris]